MPDGKPCTYTSILLHLLYTEPVAQQKCIAFSIYTKISSPFLHSHCFLPVFAFCSVHRHSLLPDANFNRSIHWLMGNNRLLSISTLGRKSRLILGILWPPQVSAMASTHPSLRCPVSHFFSLPACFTPLPFEIVYIISNMFCPLFAWDRRIQPDSPITLNRVGWQRICSVKHGDGKFFLAYFIFHPKNIYFFLFIIQCLTLKNLPHAINLVKVMWDFLT